MSFNRFTFVRLDSIHVDVLSKMRISCNKLENIRNDFSCNLNILVHLHEKFFYFEYVPLNLQAIYLELYSNLELSGPYSA